MIGAVQEDKRIRRTKKLLRQALTRLMQQKDFQSITVTDVVREADIKAWRDYNNLHFIQCACRFTERCATCGGEKGSKRDEMKELIAELRNNRIAIATVPGEPFIKFQIDWKREMQPDHVIPFFFGYTWNNGRWPMYLPDIRSAAYGGFGADEGSWLIEVGAGEKIFNKLIENYYRMMGVFR